MPGPSGDGGELAIGIAAGAWHTCGLRPDGTAQCWGNNDDGQTTAPDGQFTAIAAGTQHSCALRDDNTAQCWGEFAPPPAPEPEIQYSPVSAGETHSCSLRTDQTVLCWGSDYYGQLQTPAGPLLAVSAGGHHTCGLRDDGHAVCWGNDNDGQSTAPAGQFSSVAAGTWHSCGVRENGAVECWGRDDDGQADSPGGRFTAVSAGWAHSCGIRENGAVQCWGNNWAGQLDAPEGQFTAVSAGWAHSCGIRENGAVQCWGDRRGKRLSAPVGPFAAVSAGELHSCGIRENGAVECWGDNDDNQTDAPDGQFTAISAGTWHSCGLRTDQTVECWGRYVRPVTGTIDVHVHYCAASDAGYTEADLRYEIDRLNRVVASFYAEQSSDMVSLNFEFGGIVSPDIDWDDLLIGDWYRENDNMCWPEVQKSNHQNNLILADILPGNGASGFAPIIGDWAITATVEQHFASLSGCTFDESTDRVRDQAGQNGCRVLAYAQYFTVIAHELGHSLFGFGHPRDCSIMDNIRLPSCENEQTIEASGIGCMNRRQLGWPEGDECQVTPVSALESATPPGAAPSTSL